MFLVGERGQVSQTACSARVRESRAAAMVVANLIAWAYLLGPWSDAEPSGAPTEPDATPTAFVENVRALTSR